MINKQLTTLCAGVLLTLPALLAYGEPAATPAAPASSTTTTAPASIVAPVPAGSILLRYKFVKGQQHSYTMAMDNHGSVTVNGQTVPVNQHIDMAFRQTVTDVDPATGNATVQMQFDTFTMAMNGRPMPLPPSALAPLKTPGTVVMSPTGKIVSATLPGVAAATGGQSPWSSMQSSPVLPDQPIKPGDNWQQSQTIPGMGLSAEVPMFLAGIVQHGGHTVARINQSYNMDFKAKPGAAGAVMGSQTGTMTGTGIEMFDNTLGLPTSMDMTAHMDTHVGVPAPPAAGGQGAPPPDVHAVMDMHMVMTLTDKSPG